MTVEGTVKTLLTLVHLLILEELMDYFIFQKCPEAIENPKKLFKIGDKLTTFIKDIQGEKIALSLSLMTESMGFSRGKIR